MKFKELSGMAKSELNEKLKQVRMDLIKSNAQVATGTTPKNSGQIREMKKTIAKIKSILKNTEEKNKETATEAKTE